ncbi:MAG: hypothetical protein KDC87_02610 [Planctomycetes bacterium]|nr:hypothetical protein [Planctomycetota bacterium]
MKSLWTAALLASLLPAQNPRTASTPTRILVGKVTGAQGGHSVLVRCFKLRTGRDGGAVPLSKHEFFHTAPCQEVLAEDGVFEIMDLPPGHYSLVAFEDLDGDGKLGYDPPEPLGWYASEPAGGIAPIDVRQESKELAFALRRPTPLPKALEHRHAALRGTVLTGSGARSASAVGEAGHGSSSNRGSIWMTDWSVIVRWLPNIFVTQGCWALIQMPT